jgi:sporulation protein YlmC with PRC-barrel domain
MPKTYIPGFLVVAAALAAPVAAQTPNQPATAPSTTAPAAPAPGTSGGTVTFITVREPGVWRASDLRDKDVYGPNNERIGEIEDVLVNQSGQVTGVVLEVGGFLGIGEREVAVPLPAVRLGVTVVGAGGTAGTVPNTQPRTIRRLVECGLKVS